MNQQKSWDNLGLMFMGTLCLPLDNATSEQGFSASNDIKTAKRNKLMDPLLALMLISIYRNKFEYDYVI